jgi:hypothetical protein
VTAETDRKNNRTCNFPDMEGYSCPLRASLPPSLVLVRHVPIHGREQDLAAHARFPPKRATGAPKNLYRQAGTAHQLICAVAVVGLVAVGLLSCGLMLDVRFQRMQGTVRKD